MLSVHLILHTLRFRRLAGYHLPSVPRYRGNKEKGGGQGAEKGNGMGYFSVRKHKMARESRQGKKTLVSIKTNPIATRAGCIRVFPLGLKWGVRCQCVVFCCFFSCRELDQKRGGLVGIRIIPYHSGVLRFLDSLW